MKEYLVCETSDYGISLCHARRFDDEEKKKYVEGYRERGFVCTSNSIKLNSLCFSDYYDFIKDKESDGSFDGCCNQAYIITEKEWNELIALNEKKGNEEKVAKNAESLAFYESVVRNCEEQEKLYTEEEAAKKAREWNEIYNEDGEGYIPHFYTVNEYKNAKAKIEELRGRL